MAYDVDRLLELIHCYTGSMIEAQIAADEIDRQQKRKKDALDAADRDWRGIMDMLAEAGTELEEARALREQVEAERAECGRAEMPEEEVVPVPSRHTDTCGECKYWDDDKTDGMGTCLCTDCDEVKRGEMEPSCIYFEPREEPAAQAETPTEDGPEVSCMECKYAVREDVRTNTWHCSKGLAFMGFAKGRCSEYEEKPQESGTEGRRMCGTCKNCQPRGADPDIVECDHPTVGTIHIGRWSDACDKYEEAKP